MEILKNAIANAYQIANIQIPLFGYTISMWALVLFVVIGALVMWLISDGFE